jgi:hypothetical protein
MSWVHASCVLRLASCQTLGELIRGRDAANGTLEACAPQIHEFRCEKFRETFMGCFDFIHDDAPFSPRLSH